MRDFYKILGVDYDADDKAILKAYTKRMTAYYADVNSSPDATEKFQEVYEACETLLHPASRRSYDFAIKVYYASDVDQFTAVKPARKRSIGAALVTGVGAMLSRGVGSVLSFLAYWVVLLLIRALFAAISSNTPTAHYGVDPNNEVKPFRDAERKPGASVFVNADEVATPVGTPYNSLGYRFSSTGAITQPSEVVGAR